MDFSLKEAFGLLIGLITASIVIVAFFKFGLFSAMIQIIEGVI